MIFIVTLAVVLVILGYFAFCRGHGALSGFLGGVGGLILTLVILAKIM